eukprot:gene27364-33711_t
MAYEEVEIEDMSWDEDILAYTYECPCGDLFQITLEELKDANNAGDLTSLSLAVAELTCVTQAVDVAEAILGLCTVTGGSATLSTGDCEKVREYIAGAMPFGTPLDTSAATTLAVRSKGFGTGDVATREQQPAWKPHLFQGRTKLHFVVREELQCWFHQELTPVAFSLAGCLDCRADLEGLPDVTAPLLCNSCPIASLTVHPCVQAPGIGEGTNTSLCFTPPLGDFVLARFVPELPLQQPPPVAASYVFTEVSSTELKFSLRLKLDPKYLGGTLEACEVALPFFGRGRISALRLGSTS